jgi:hypothetical protein
VRDLTPLSIVIVDDPESKGMNGPMSSTVWAAPATRLHEANILRFLKDARCSVRVIEVSLFKECIFDRVGTRRWKPDGNLPKTAKEILNYIADNGSVDATLVVSDEV